MKEFFAIVTFVFLIIGGVMALTKHSESIRLNKSRAQAARLSTEIAAMKQDIGEELQALHGTSCNLDMDSSLIFRIEKLGELQGDLRKIYIAFPKLSTPSIRDKMSKEEQ